MLDYYVFGKINCNLHKLCYFLKYLYLVAIVLSRGIQTVITGNYLAKTANRLGGGGYFYNRRLAVIEEITDSFITVFQFGFWAGFRPVLSLF